MITEKELIDAIRQCEKEPVTQSKIARLADFYIVYDHLFGDPYGGDYYSAAKPPETTLTTNRGTEFLAAVDGKDAEKVWAIINELVDVVRALHPRVYDGVLEKLNNI